MASELRLALRLGLLTLLCAGTAGADQRPARGQLAGADCAGPLRSPGPYVPCSEVAGVVDAELGRLTSDDDRARLLYCRGVQRLEADGTDALACFERSSQLRPHALTLLNIAVTRLRLERYLEAQSAAEQALARHAQTGELCAGAAAGGCPEPEQAQSLIEFAATRQVRLRVRLSPADAHVAVDGRPLLRASGAAELPRYRVGEAGASPALAPGARFELLVDPGFHSFSVESRGFARSTIHRSFQAGEQSELELTLSRLPAVLRIRADRPDAIVQINDLDVGPAPVDVQRPPGSYDVVVLKAGFQPYETRVRVAGGESLTMSARLVERPPPITKTWWFWTSLGAFLASSALLYYVAQPAPEPPPYDGGSTRWVVAPAGAVR